LTWIADVLRIGQAPRRQWMVYTPDGFVPHPANAAIPWTTTNRAEALVMARSVRGGRARDAAGWVDKLRARRADRSAD
jgi:hypothetical protein